MALLRKSNHPEQVQNIWHNTEGVLHTAASYFTQGVQEG